MNTIPQVRELAARMAAADIDRCVDSQVADGTNACGVPGSGDQPLKVLAQAAWVRHQMEDKGMTEVDALRDLARRMRQVQGA